MNETEIIEMIQKTELATFTINGLGETTIQTKELDFLIQAYAKQIPKKVKGLSQTYEGYVGNCPHCGKFITRRESKLVCVYENCLQRLDWSEEAINEQC